MTGSIRAPERGARRPVLLAAALVALAAGAAGAELVVLVDGAVLKVESFHAEGERGVLVYPGGGRVEVPIERIERVVDDEIVPEPPPGEATAVPLPAFDLRWRDGQSAPATPFAAEILAAARRHGLNPALVAAVARVESAFDPRAVSRKGARGLMQLMPATGKRFGLRTHELFDPARNLDAGSRYLAWLADRFADELPLVLAGYNAGEGAVARHGGVPPYRETRDYVKRVYSWLGLEPEGVAAAGGR
jgi:hypothetical protein